MIDKIHLNAPPVRNPRRVLQVIAVIVLNFFIIALFSANDVTATETLSKYGSRGEEVRQIQTKLIRWGYLNDKVDGIYGNKTRDAVVWFQKKNGLTADGIAGPATLRAMGIYSSSSSGSGSSSGGSSGGSGKFTQSDINLMARMISAESRGEPYTGQVAVGAVILNRIAHPSFPDTLSGVLYQNGAFSALLDGQFNQPVAESAYKAANDAISGWDPTGGAIYYYNPRTATNQWIRSRPVVATIGKHVFCK